MSQITSNTTLKEILKKISELREQKGKERETLLLIEQAFPTGHEFVVNLLWEKALTYQHLLRNEELKQTKANNEFRKECVFKMKEAAMLAKYYVVRFDLDLWKSRMYLFLGKVDDFSEDYVSAIKNYKRSLRFVRFDPNFKKGIPVSLEIDGHLSFSMIKNGQVQKGYDLAMATYNKFDSDKMALSLKDDDFYTWAVWKSGVALRSTAALLEIKSTEQKADLKDWLNDVENILVPQKDFSYRFDQLKALKAKL
jgi:hypothetical protein